MSDSTAWDNHDMSWPRTAGLLLSVVWLGAACGSDGHAQVAAENSGRPRQMVDTTTMSDEEIEAAARMVLKQDEELRRVLGPPPFPIAHSGPMFIDDDRRPDGWSFILSPDAPLSGEGVWPVGPVCVERELVIGRHRVRFRHLG